MKILITSIVAMKNDELDRELMNVYDGVECMPVSPVPFDENWNIDHIALEKYKNWPNCSFHASFENLPSGFEKYNMNLADRPNKKIKKALMSQIEVSSILTKNKPTILVVHPGVVETDKEKVHRIRNIVENLKNVVDFAGEKQVILTLENLERKKNYYSIGQFYEELLEIKKSVGNSLKFNFDLGHALTVGGFDYAGKIISVLGKDIIYSHIHYNNSSEDQHLPLTEIGNDMRRFEEIIKSLVKNTSITKYGFINLELPVGKLRLAYPEWRGFKLYTRNHQIESCRILREILSKVGS